MSLIGTIASGAVGGPAGAALSVLSGAKKAGASAVDWVTGNAAHLLLVLLAGALAWGWIGHHHAARWEKFAHSLENARKADNRTWAGADRTNHKSIDDLILVLNNQSGFIRTWASAAEAKQKAAQAALRAATARGARAEGLAQRIDAERAAGGSGGPNCRSGKAVIDAKGEL